MYDHDPTANIQQASLVARCLRQAGMIAYDANTLAILGMLPGTNGRAIQQALPIPPTIPSIWFDSIRQRILPLGGRRIPGSAISVEESFARMAALGYDSSPEPIAFHCPEDGCHARTQLMLDRLQYLGLLQTQLRRVWAWAERSLDPHRSRMRPTHEDGGLFQEYDGSLIEWDFHVAPAILAEGRNASVDLVVLDPSLASQPIDVQHWHLRIGTSTTNTVLRQITEIGVPPIHPRTGRPFPGSGYGPWPDPVSYMATQHAAMLMVDLMAQDAVTTRPARPLPFL